jgi:hypothetical protein
MADGSRTARGWRRAIKISDPLKERAIARQEKVFAS